MHSPSWEANWFAASQEFPHISRNPKVHYRTHKRPLPVSILGQPNPVHIPTSHLLQIHPNIIHPSTSRSPQWSPSRVNYITWINDNNALINDYGRFQNLILRFEIPMGTRKDFFEIYRQFGYASPKRFASPALRKEYKLEISKCYSKIDYLFGHCLSCWGLQSQGSESDLYPSSGIKGVVQFSPSKEGLSQSLDTKRSFMKGPKTCSVLHCAGAWADSLYLLSDVPFSDCSLMETSEQWISLLKRLAETGELNNPAPAWARGDYVWIGQAARERTACRWVPHLVPDGSRKQWKTFWIDAELSSMFFLCVKHAIVVSGFFADTKWKNIQSALLLLLVLRITTFPIHRKLPGTWYFFFGHPDIFDKFLEFLQR